MIIISEQWSTSQQSTVKFKRELVYDRAVTKAKQKKQRRREKKKREEEERWRREKKESTITINISILFYSIIILVTFMLACKVTLI